MESKMTHTCKYGFGTEIPLRFEEAIDKMEALLQKRGFKVHTKLNLKDIVEGAAIGSLGQYVILGACNAEFARELFSADPDIGMLMPCNIIVYELNREKSRIMVKDPLRIMDLIDNPLAISAAMKVHKQMEEIIDELKNEKA
jgi:uncharacterized protein (DUF302 family)